MFDKILIANRGEIACRIIKTAQRMGVRTVAVYSDADKKALHTTLADEAVYIGASPSKDSYLVAERVVQAALQTGAQAIHPGYGFLSENADFAQSCADNNLVFIGPPITAIESMGSKSAAKVIMGEAKVPLVPGYHGADQDPKIIKASADEMGYPVLLKAVAGGGGKGMRQVWSAEEFDQGLADAKREAMASFANDDMLVEKYLTQPRHVEVQVFCDKHQNAVYLFERDCSVQRRHQKVVEEAPAPNLSESLRQQLGLAAVRAAQAINYQGAGTVEFLLDADGSFYFMEMNTRLQVEHPVTEYITGQDLVEWQLRVANGEALPLSQDQLAIHGHSFEARIYAEDPSNDFLPTSGTLEYLVPPLESAHVRVDTGVLQGDEVSPYYDPMIAKLVVWDENRDRALSRMAQALSEYHIGGITTNISFLHRIISNQAFINADLDTSFIEKNSAQLFAKDTENTDQHLPLITLYLVLMRESVRCNDIWDVTDGWRMNQANRHSFTIQIEENNYELVATEIYQNGMRQFRISGAGSALVVSGSLKQGALQAEVDGHKQSAAVIPNGLGFSLITQGCQSTDFSVVEPDYGDDSAIDSGAGFTAPMNGTIVDVFVAKGEYVEEGSALLIMEAMKMQHTISAPAAGVVTDLYCSTGELVDGGATLLGFEAE